MAFCVMFISFAFYHRVIYSCSLIQWLPYLWLCEVLASGLTLALQPCDSNSTSATPPVNQLTSYRIRHLTRLRSEWVLRCSSACIETKVYCYRNYTATGRSPIVALKMLWLVWVGWRVRGATNPCGGQVAIRLLRGYNIDTTATLLT
jgi:hypothetical protein